MVKNTLTLTEINNLFYINNGLLIWNTNVKNKSRINKVAGYINNQGYYILELNNRGYLVHRLMYQIYNNFEILQDDIEIDHIDGNKNNNSKENLRLATRSQNQHNVGIKSTNKSGYKDIYHAFQNKRKNEYWKVSICLNHKYFQKVFPYTEEGLKMAIEYRQSKLLELHGHFSNTGEIKK